MPAFNGTKGEQHPTPQKTVLFCKSERADVLWCLWFQLDGKTNKWTMRACRLGSVRAILWVIILG